MKKRAFTLAEVLITLGVIGVVAAMTLSPLIQNYQKQETANKLKKMYTKLNNVMQMAVNDYGDMSNWDFSEMGVHLSNSKFLSTYFIPYLQIIQKDKSWEVCSIDGISYLSSVPWQVLSDGTAISGFNNWLFIDINGKNSPNRFGKDIFLLNFDKSKNRIIFEAQGQTNEQLKSDYAGGGYLCTKGSNRGLAGAKCGAKIMQDGWKIEDDYPW